jgi:outer membrane protein
MSAVTKLRQLARAIGIVSVLVPLASRGDEGGEWFARIGGLAALYDSSARVATPAGVIPGASAHVNNNYTPSIELGYDFTSQIYAMLMAGYPPRPKISGRGSIDSIGELGAVDYGPLVATVGYRVPFFGRIEPYFGVGAAYAIILRDHDAAVEDLHVRNNFGFAVQAGVEYPLTRRWQIFMDVRRLWLSVDATGALGGEVPIAARVRLDPTLITLGWKVKL